MTENWEAVPEALPAGPLTPAERADLDALLRQGWRYNGWTSADDRLNKLEGYTERLVAQLAAAEAERDRLLSGDIAIFSAKRYDELIKAEAERDALRSAFCEADAAALIAGGRYAVGTCLHCQGVQFEAERDRALFSRDQWRQIAHDSGMLLRNDRQWITTAIQDRDALRARAERAEAALHRIAVQYQLVSNDDGFDIWYCHACGDEWPKEVGEDDCAFCIARAYFQEPPARAGEVTG